MGRFENISISALDINGNLVQTFDIEIDVQNVNDAPVITSSPITSATEDILYQYQIESTDDDLGGIIDPSTLSALRVWVDATNIDGAHNTTLNDGDRLSGKFKDASLEPIQTNTSYQPLFSKNSSLLNNLSVVI